MFEEDFNKIPHADKKEFARVTNLLLLKGFIVRDYFDQREKIIRISDEYRFIERYFNLFEDYLSFSGWNLEKDVLNGVFVLLNQYGDNRIRIDRETSLLLFTLRLIFEEEHKEGSSMASAIYLTTPQLIKFMMDHGIIMPGKRLSGRQISKSLRFLVNHNVISKVSGSYDEGNVSFYILPSIIYALDNQKIVAMSEAIDKLQEKENEDDVLGVMNYENIN